MLSVVVLSAAMLGVVVLSVFMLSAIVLSVAMLSVVMFSVAMVSVVVLSVSMLSVVVPSVVMLSVVVPNVVAPSQIPLDDSKFIFPVPVIDYQPSELSQKCDLISQNLLLAECRPGQMSLGKMSPGY